MAKDLLIISFATVNLALALSGLPAAADGARLRVGILDLDIFGPSLPKLMGLEGMGEPMLTSGAFLCLFDCSTITANLMLRRQPPYTSPRSRSTMHVDGVPVTKLNFGRYQQCRHARCLARDDGHEGGSAASL